NISAVAARLTSLMNISRLLAAVAFFLVSYSAEAVLLTTGETCERVNEMSAGTKAAAAAALAGAGKIFKDFYESPFKAVRHYPSQEWMLNGPRGFVPGTLGSLKATLASAAPY